MSNWEFWIDVGGTFTDCLARSPEGAIVSFKTLSSGATKGRLRAVDPDSNSFRDPRRVDHPPGFWIGYRLGFSRHPGQFWTVVGETPEAGRIVLDRPLPADAAEGLDYELVSPESAPLVCIRSLLGLSLTDPIPEVTVKLGTTRGTNALLERKGARFAFVTTRGLADVLTIGNQNRPRLFDLDIVLPAPLAETVVEIDERMDADGNVVQAPDPRRVAAKLQAVFDSGIRSLAICLLHGYRNNAHELLIERIAREIGFEELSVSSRLAPAIKIVSRGDTTSVDAYLSPVLRSYLHEIRAKLGAGSRLKLMTSGGGLIDAEHFVGKDSILSGPAGGVIGYARAADRAGIARAIGFDMGGTSTDVSRYDGSFEREFETEKGGVRIVAPMLAIETVAAGGGSICRFDGVQLSVGPESAGADPGPACYGRGGPLSVTDLNLHLGRLLPEEFPFPLDAAAAEQRLAELCRQVEESPLGQSYTTETLAEGLLEIANQSMVRAIRKISVARGYDPAEYTLVTFGGAGAQHACAIARALGMRSILIHPHAGILSAFGIGLADVRRFRERAVLKPDSVALRTELETLFAELEREAIEEVRAEGIPGERIRPPIRSFDLRYLGGEATLNVAWPEDDDLRAAFEQRHRARYGYVHAGRPLEVTVARVEVIGEMPQPSPEQHPLHDREPPPRRVIEAIFAGVRRPTAVHGRSDLRPGDRITGPAIIQEPLSTIVIEPGFTARIDNQNCVRIEVTDPPREVRIGTQADPVMLEIFNNLFASIAEQMGVTLRRTSFSTNVKERLDFSCAIFSPRGDLVVNAPHIPVHLGAMSETVKRVLADHPQLASGDVYVTNDPYRGGSHLPDVTVVTPVHDERGEELLFLTASRAHHAEIGGIVPGSMPPFSTNLAEEGVLISNFKLVERGVSREGEFRELLLSGPYPTRSVEANLADVAAQVAANNLGAAQLRELIRRYSLPVVRAYMSHIQQAATEKMKRALTRLGRGEYRFVDHLDDGSPIAVSITIGDAVATIDFTGTGPVLGGNLNANLAIVQAAVMYVMLCLIDEEIPLNSGVMAPIELIVPECLLNPPHRETPAQSAAVVGGNVETSQRVVDVLLGALGLAAASQGTMNNFSFGSPTFGYYETICGGAGAPPHRAGADAVHTHMTNTRLTDVEVIENRYPVRVLEFSIRRGSGGAGRHRGGDGVVRRIEFLQPLDVSLLTERRGPYAPYGREGGQPGALGENWLQPADAETARKLPGKIQFEVQPGDVLTIATPGGGGWGPPP
jgi:5-oxoprolinase (ATP-hydrolysing)